MDGSPRYIISYDFISVLNPRAKTWNSMNIFRLELLMYSPTKFVIKAGFVTKTRQQHEFQKSTKIQNKTIHCYENGMDFCLK